MIHVIRDFRALELTRLSLAGTPTTLARARDPHASHMFTTICFGIDRASSPCASLEVAKMGDARLRRINKEINDCKNDKVSGIQVSLIDGRHSFKAAHSSWTPLITSFCRLLLLWPHVRIALPSGWNFSRARELSIREGYFRCSMFQPAVAAEARWRKCDPVMLADCADCWSSRLNQCCAVHCLDDFCRTLSYPKVTHSSPSR